MTLDPARAALALGDDAVFLGELRRRVGKALPGLEEARAGFAAQLEIPVLREVFGEGEVLFLRGSTALLAADRSLAPRGTGGAAAV